MNAIPFAESLRRAADPVWNACLNHPFVAGIGSGTLNMQKFRHYMIQDYLYLYAYAKVFALGLVKARDPELICDFAGHVHTILHGEMNIHRAYMKRLNITEAQLLAARPAPDNLSYTNYMLAVAHDGTPLEIAVSILACSWTYGDIGCRLAAIPGAADHPDYGEWIRGYSSGEYSASNDALIALVNRLARNVSPEQSAYLHEIFINCCRYELAFWDMAWEMRA